MIVQLMANSLVIDATAVLYTLPYVKTIIFSLQKTDGKS